MLILAKPLVLLQNNADFPLLQILRSVQCSLSDFRAEQLRIRVTPATLHTLNTLPVAAHREF